MTINKTEEKSVKCGFAKKFYAFFCFCPNNKSTEDCKCNKAKIMTGIATLISIICIAYVLLFESREIIQFATALLIPILFIILIYAYSDGEFSSLQISASWGILGFSLLIFGVYSNSELLNPHVISILINLSSTLISLAIIGIILQLKDTRDYFATTLSELIMQDSYISKLNRSQLERLQKTVLERYFENKSDLNRENSFYRFFSSNLQKFIGSPYRENYRNTISINPKNNKGSITGENNSIIQQDSEKYQNGSATHTYHKLYDELEIIDSLSYQIRSMGKELQPTILWRATKDEIRELRSFSVTLNNENIFSWPSENQEDPNDSETEAGADTEFITHNFSQNPEDGVEIIIEISRLANIKPKISDQYKDGSIVKIKAEYSVTNYKSITSKLLYPTKGLSLSIFHPSEIRCKIESFGFDSEVSECEHNHTTQGFTLDYPNWLLPFSGVYVSIERI